MRRTTIASAVGVALAIATALAGCSQATDSSAGEPGRPSPAYSGPIPSFSGPWASEFAEAYRSTTSEVVHRILKKESITDRDYTEVSSSYVKCMANKGFKAEVTGPFGESVVDTGRGDDAAQQECDQDLSVIAALRRNVDRNPEHRDEEEIVAACLVDKKVAPPGYSKRDYEADLQAQRFPYSIDDPGFSKCVNDPLGLASGK